MSRRVAALLVLALLSSAGAAEARRKEDVGRPRSRAVLRARGVEIDRRSVERALAHGETTWARLREMHSEEVLLEKGETKDEFLVMNSAVVPAVVRHLFRDQDEEHRRLAQEAHDKARAGEDWSKLVALYSTEPGAGTAGDLGVVAFDNLVAPFNRVMFDAPIGVVQPPVQTMFGWHVGKVVEVIPPRDVTRADGTVIRRPETRHVQQILVVWDVGEHEDGRRSDLRVELVDLLDQLDVEVLDRSYCDRFPHWCGPRPAAGKTSEP